MIKMLKTIIEKIENSQMSFWQGILLIYIASFFRGFLESFTNSDNQNRLMGVIDTFFHYPLWFAGLFLFVFILLKILIREKIEKISRLGAVFSFIIILAPVLDLIIHKGQQVRYAFIVGSFSDLVKSFFTFLGSIDGGALGATIGIKIEILMALIFAGYYIFYKTKKISRSTTGVVFIYLLIFLFAVLPIIIFGIHNLAIGNEQPITYRAINDFYYQQEPASAFGFNKTFILDRNNFESPKIQNIKNQYSITVSIILLLIDVLLLGWWFFLYDKKKFFSMIKNFRYLRLIHYLLMIVVGIFFGIMFAGRNPIESLFDFLSFVSLFLSFLFAAFFCIWENDEIDVEIDKISNQGRPLVKKDFLITEWRDTKYLFLFLAFNFAFLTGLYTLIFISLFLTIYHIYSAPPLKLKRFLGISSFLIAVNALIAVWMGFFMSAGTENFKAFPLKYIFGILIIFFLAENVKNLKDIEGDKKNGVKTLPVILGEEKGKLVIGGLCFLSALLVPFVFYMSTYTFFTAVVFGTVLFFLVTKKKFQEKYIFITYFIFTAVFVFEVLIFNFNFNILAQKAENSARLGWLWLENYDKKLLDPGIPLIIKTINEKYCRSSEVDFFWKKKSGEFENHYYLSVFERFFNNGENYKISGKVINILNTPQEYYNDALAQALYCDLYPVRQDFAKNTFDNIKNETGYDLTHKFWSAILFKNNGCFVDSYDLDEIISKAAEKIIEEQENSKEFGDLYVERTAFLISYGFKEKVKDDWIKNITKNQSASGSWSTPMSFNNHFENPHTTALAIWVLAEYSQKCPF